MKQSIIIIGLCLLIGHTAIAQFGKVDSNVTFRELEVPTSPAFILAETTPSMIQTPLTPKQFVLGAIQSYEQSGGNGFPQNYSVEFAPYWWLKPANRSVYALVGLKKSGDSILSEDPFAGVKFATISMAFLSKDLVPDNFDVTQKIFSAGLRTTLIKVHGNQYGQRLSRKINAWHEAAQSELGMFIESIARADSIRKRVLMKEAANFKPSTTSKLLEEINAIFLEKPRFTWDIAGAYAVYGVGDTSWRTGRTGVWTNLATHIPLSKEQEIKTSYLNLNVAVRLLSDNYFKNEKEVITRTTMFDVGGKIAFEFNRISFGYEYFKRLGDEVGGDQKRSVGVVNYKLSDNLYINGAFGNNFNLPNKLVAFLGIQWGLGTETVQLP